MSLNLENARLKMTKIKCTENKIKGVETCPTFYLLVAYEIMYWYMPNEKFETVTLI